MTNITQLSWKKSTYGSRILMVFLVLGIIAISAGSARAQWTTNGNNINNTNTGNVGIGTTGPTAKLDVQRNDGSDLMVRAWNAATSSGAAIFRAAASSNASESARLEFSDSTGFNGGVAADRTNGMTFRTGSAAASYSAMGVRMTITTGGNVGIGVTNPGVHAKFEVNGAGAPDYAIFSDYLNSTLRIGRSGTTLQLKTDDSQNLALMPGGKVGIGTTSHSTRSTLTVGLTAFARKLQLL